LLIFSWRNEVWFQCMLQKTLGNYCWDIFSEIQEYYTLLACWNLWFFSGSSLKGLQLKGEKYFILYHCWYKSTWEFSFNTSWGGYDHGLLLEEREDVKTQKRRLKFEKVQRQFSQTLLTTFWKGDARSWFDDIWEGKRKGGKTYHSKWHLHPISHSSQPENEREWERGGGKEMKK